MRDGFPSRVGAEFSNECAACCLEAEQRFEHRALSDSRTLLPLVRA